MKLLERDFTEAEKLLEDYEGRKTADIRLHRQFTEQERAQAAWLKREGTQEVLRHLNQAVSQTMDAEEEVRKLVNFHNALSAEELKLLLFRFEVCRQTRLERPTEELDAVLAYIDRRQMDDVEKVKVYPYAVLLRAEEADLENEYEYIVYLLKKAFRLLCEEGRPLYMAEIMDRYSKVLALREGGREDARRMEEARACLLAVEREFGADFENYRLFQHMNRSFELDYELIRNSRIALGLSQEELCGDICTRETLSRVETGKRRPSNKNLEELLKQMRRERHRINTVITTEEFDMITLKRQIAKHVQRKEYEKAETELRRLEYQVGSDTVENRQYLLGERIRIRIERGELSKEQAVQELKKILELTLDWDEEQEIIHQLTVTESDTLNQIAVCFCTKEEKEVERGIRIWENILKNYHKSRVLPVFRIREWEMFISNLAALNVDGKDPDRAVCMAKEAIKTSLGIGKGNQTGRLLTTIACAYEQKWDVKCSKYFRWALCLLKLTNMEYHYQCLMGHKKESQFLAETEDR